MSRFRLWMASLLVLGSLSGCGRQAAPPDSAASGDAASGNSSAASGGATANVSPSAAAPQNAAQAVLTALEHVRTGKLEQAYDFLPPTFQQDVDGLVHEAAGKMDPDLWEALFRVADKGVQVLREQREAILALLSQQPQPGPSANQEAQLEQLRQNWMGLVDALELLVRSELGDLEKLRKVNVRRWVATTGNPVYAKLQSLAASSGTNPLDQLKETTAELVSEDGDQAVVELSGPQQPAPQTTAFVKIDGRWVPKSLADNWQTSLDQAREQLRQITPEQIAAQKERVLKSLTAVEATLDQMLAAETPEQFQAAVLPLVLQVMQFQNGLQQPLKPRAENSVTLVINRELSDDEETRLLGRLEKLTDDPERSEPTSTTTGGRTMIVLRPVKDVVAFAEKLSFARDKSVDASTRTIEIKDLELAD